MEKEESFKHGKYAQQKELSGDVAITDDILESFLAINMKHVGLARGKDQDEDVSLISWFTNKKFLWSIELFHKLNLININEAQILQYVFNVVNENSLKIPLQPQNFKGILFPPQAALIKRMLDIEFTPITFKLSKSSAIFTGGIVSERLSFGKTFCIPALICQKSYVEQTMPVTQLTEIIYNNTIFTNLVICGTKVAKEWKNNLKNLTSLSFIVVERANHLDELSTLISKQEYPEVLVVKDGDITWNNKKDKALSHVLKLLESKTFMRVFFDDYDMLNLRDIISPNALFTWFISGTNDTPFSGLKFYYWSENGTQCNISMKSCHPILDAVSSVSCNKEYSVVEYNVPKINEYYYNSNDLLDFVCKIVNNKNVDELVDGDDLINTNDRLLTGTKDVPYIYDRSNLKMLVAMDDKDSQKSLVSALNSNGIKSVKLTRANVDKFAREDTTVCVCGNLFGVNLPFLTHIVICVNDFIPSACTQIIGRGQRLSRKQNLQVYMFEGY
jgi:hypothetical protein